jgi:ribosome-associated protein
MDDQPFKDVTIPDSDEALLAECRIETFRAGGPGGQHQNKSETGVRVVHVPTGVRAIARDERSQLRNRALALARLRVKLEALAEVPPSRRATRIPKREKRKRLASKRQRGDTKKLRKRPDPDVE